MDLFHLPDEILLEIISYLPATDLDRLQGVNRKLYQLCQDNSVWLTRSIVDFWVAPSLFYSAPGTPRQRYQHLKETALYPGCEKWPYCWRGGLSGHYSIDYHYLVEAIILGRLDLVQYFSQYHRCPRYVASYDHFKHYCFGFARVWGHPDIVDYLRDQLWGQQDRWIGTAEDLLCWSITNGNNEIRTLCLEKEKDVTDFRRCIWLAIQYDRRNLVKRWLRLDDPLLGQYLIIALDYKRAQMTTMIMSYLAAAGVEIDLFGATMKAIESHQYHIAWYLMIHDRRLDPDRYINAVVEIGNLQLLRLLIEKGATNLQAGLMATPRINRLEIVTYLLKHHRDRLDLNQALLHEIQHGIMFYIRRFVEAGATNLEEALQLARTRSESQDPFVPIHRRISLYLLCEMCQRE